jgi:hypothetical protein
MEGHAEMDMAVTDGSRTKRTLSRKGRTAISHNFLMDWVSIWKDNRRRSTACRSARCLGPKGVLEGILFRVSSNLGEVLGGSRGAAGCDRLVRLFRGKYCGKRTSRYTADSGPRHFSGCFSQIGRL